MCCPPVALLCGSTLARWEGFWEQELPSLSLRLCLGGRGAGLLRRRWPGRHQTRRRVRLFPAGSQLSDPPVHPTRGQAHCLRRTNLGGRCCFCPRGRVCASSAWKARPGGPLLRGCMSCSATRSDLRRLKSLGYNKLVLLSESPARFAIVAVNPGSQRAARTSTRRRISPNGGRLAGGLPLRGYPHQRNPLRAGLRLHSGNRTTYQGCGPWITVVVAVAVATNSAPVRFCQAASVVLCSYRLTSPTTTYLDLALPNLLQRIAQEDMFHAPGAEGPPQRDVNVIGRCP